VKAPAKKPQNVKKTSSLRRLIDRETNIEQLRRVAIAQQAAIEELAKKVPIEDVTAAVQNVLSFARSVAEPAPVTTDPKAFEGSDSPPENSSSPEKKQGVKRGSTEQPRLVREEKIFELDEADRACTACGGALHEMKDQFETSEMIDVIDVQYRVVEVKQKKYACTCGACIETAIGPERVTRGGRYAMRFGIKVVIDKYLDHIPLDRQQRIMGRQGLVVTSQTLWEQALAIATKLEKTTDAILAAVLTEPVIGLDQTCWPNLEKGAKKAWQMWCVTSPRAVVHRIRKDKSAETFQEILRDYQGVIVCDAFSTHESGARGSPAILLAGCWAHVFRKFEEAAPDHPAATDMLKWIGQLYAIDDEAKGDVDARARLRKEHAPNVLARMQTWLEEIVVLDRTSIGKAASYVRNHWESLTRFVDNARIPLDNNASERAFRGPVVGRKNHYGSRSELGTKVAAILYTLIESAKVNGIDPAKYLEAALRAAADGKTLMPWDFARD
jgi:transposase